MRDLADGEAGQERTRDRPEGEVAELHAADEVAERDGEEDRELGILLEEACEPVHARLPADAGAAAQVSISTITRPQSVSSVLLTA